ncbi:unnamed protein product, partial [Ceratitis capitata]
MKSGGQDDSAVDSITSVSSTKERERALSLLQKGDRGRGQKERGTETLGKPCVEAADSVEARWGGTPVSTWKRASEVSNSHGEDA